MTEQAFDTTWIDEFADRLGMERLTRDRIDELLEMSGDAAHTSEDRRNAPLACYLTGLAK